MGEVMRSQRVQGRAQSWHPTRIHMLAQHARTVDCTTLQRASCAQQDIGYLTVGLSFAATDAR